MGDQEVGITSSRRWSSGSCIGRSMILGRVGTNGGFLFGAVW
jgi:hypothetical protein